MVLAKKKLKQKLRCLLAESLAATESKESQKTTLNKDVNQQLQSIKELLGSKSRKSRLSKPRTGKKKRSFSEDSKPDEGIEETQKENGEKVDSISLKKKGKRKREGEGAEASTETKPKKKKKKPKKKRDLRKQKDKGKKEDDEREEKGNEKGDECMEEESNKKVVEEPTIVDESEAKKVYVGGIPYYSTEDDIMSFFESCGTVTEMDCMTFPESGKFRGIAILTFKTEAAAKRALALDGADMGGLYLKVQPYKANRTPKSEYKSDFAPEIVDGYNRAYVGNLSWDVTEEDLKQFFSDCKISSIRFGMDKETGEFKGYAHVDFSDSVSLTVALKLDQKVVCGRPARIRCAVPKKGVESNTNAKSSGKKTEDSGSVGKKRRTCYECGLPGHLSSACPKKRTVEVDGSSVKSMENVDDCNASGNAKKKKKRQTCYECGVPGHLSSACPKKKAIEVSGSTIKS